MEIFYPAFLLMFHTLGVLGFLGYRRYTSVSRREVSTDYYRAFQGEEPKKLRILSRHVVNLLELPLLFYLGVIIAFVTGQSGAVLLTLAWLYVLLRLLHSFVHLGPNVVLWRFRVFGLSLLVLSLFLASTLYGIVTR